MSRPGSSRSAHRLITTFRGRVLLTLLCVCTTVAPAAAAASAVPSSEPVSATITSSATPFTDATARPIVDASLRVRKQALRLFIFSRQF